MVPILLQSNHRQRGGADQGVGLMAAFVAGTNPASTPAAGLVGGVLDAITARAVVLDADGAVVSLNRSWLDYEAERHARVGLSVGENYFEAVSSPDAPDWWGGSRAATGILSVLTGRRLRFTMDYSVVGKDREEWFELAVEPMPHHAGGALLTHTDITERKQAEESLLVRALHDDLTGLPNRALLYDRIAQAMAKSARQGQRTVVMFLDLDRFKVVNDSLGHATGDTLLIEIAARLRRSVRYGDTVGRVGGDEFVVLCEQLSGEHEAVVIAERILGLLNDPVRIDGEIIYPSASIGIAMDSASGLTVEDLVANADSAMYLAKGSVALRYAFFDESLSVRTTDRMQDEHELRMAIEQNQLRVVYQPQYDLASGAIVGAEAMVRWHHPDRGLIAPLAFLQLAEETGLIVPLGRWVLETICKQLVSWGETGPLGEHGRVWMNLSARELAVPSLAPNIVETLALTGARPEQLGLELTEAALMHYPDAAADVLARLQASGVTVALDDFGSGHASLTYLSRFPIGAIKLDRGFVTGLGADHVAAAIAASIVTLAAGLELTVIAEGIETREQLAALQEIGIRQGQGYLFAAPLTADELDKVVRPTWWAVSA
jgi:diguanylate cyclase (GGDEF)-like protein